MGQHNEVPLAFGYLAAVAQERMLALARVDQQLHLALCNAIRCPIAEAAVAAPGRTLDVERERCAVCLEDLPCAGDGAQWPGGCGHSFHQHCVMDLLRIGHGQGHCPLCGVDQQGLPRRMACPHGHYDTCNRGCLRNDRGCWYGLPAPVRGEIRRRQLTSLARLLPSLLWSLLARLAPWLLTLLP